MNKKEKEKLEVLRELLHDLHKAWETDTNRDGHHKSQEGLVEVTYIYPNWFEAEDYLTDEPQVMISVYSYLFGPSRMHDFDSFDEAIETVREWKYTPETY